MDQPKRINTFWLKEFLLTEYFYEDDSIHFQLNFRNRASYEDLAAQVYKPELAARNLYQRNLLRSVFLYALHHFSDEDWVRHTETDLHASWISSDPREMFTWIWDVLFLNDPSLSITDDFQVYYDETDSLWENKYRYHFE
ncbi:hypothetical protein [Deinococcus sp. UYEF24]